MQPVAFERQTVDQAAFSRRVQDPPEAEPIPAQTRRGSHHCCRVAPSRPEPGSGPRWYSFGYGLHLPEQGYDDIAGVELKGKIAVVLSGGPAEISGP